MDKIVIRRSVKYCVICVVLFFLSLNSAIGACISEGGYTIELYPEIKKSGFQQDAIIYHFDQDQVTSSWSRRMIGQDGSRSDLFSKLAGTFRGGVLRCEQQSEMKIYYPEGMNHPGGGKDGLHMIIKQTSYINGNLNNQGKITGKIKTVTKEILSRVPDQKTNGKIWVWKPLPDLSGSPDEFYDLLITMPFNIWYTSDHILACGSENGKVLRILERIDDHWNSTINTIDRVQYGLAKSQLETLKADILDLKKQIDKENLDCEIIFMGLPTDGKITKLTQLRFVMEKWKESYTIVNEALGAVQIQLASIKRILAINVFKSVFKNYITWSNSMPTDVLSGLSEYDFITSLADFPRSGLSMYEESKKDGKILTAQFKTKDVLEDLEPFYDKKRDYVKEQAGRTTALIRKTKPLDLEPMDQSLLQFFSGLEWATWQEDRSRKIAFEQLMREKKK